MTLQPNRCQVLKIRSKSHSYEFHRHFYTLHRKHVCQCILLVTRIRRSNMYIQDIHKRMVQFQTLTRNLFFALHGHNVHRQQRQLSKFLMRYSSSLLMLTAGPRDQFPRWRRSRRRLSVCSVLRRPDL